MVVAWVVLGIVLLVVELHHLAFFALFGAIGSFAAAVLAVLVPSAVPLQVGVAVLVATIGMVAVRPLMSDALHRRNDGHPARGVHGTLVGEEVMTLDVVGDVGQPGHVRLAGERWLAQSGSGSPIPSGKRVLVTAVRGTTLVVWPVDGSTTFLDELSTPPAGPPDRGEEEQP